MEKERSNIKFVCISDTHDMLHKMIESNLIPNGDVLIHAGDYSSCGTEESTRKFADDMMKLPHSYKVIIAGLKLKVMKLAKGNHDHFAERNPSLLRKIFSQFIYLEDEAFLIKGIKIWGSPWTPV